MRMGMALGGGVLALSAAALVGWASGLLGVRDAFDVETPGRGLQAKVSRGASPAETTMPQPGVRPAGAPTDRARPLGNVAGGSSSEDGRGPGKNPGDRTGAPTGSEEAGRRKRQELKEMLQARLKSDPDERRFRPFVEHYLVTLNNVADASPSISAPDATKVIEVVLQRQRAYYEIQDEYARKAREVADRVDLSLSLSEELNRQYQEWGSSWPKRIREVIRSVMSAEDFARYQSLEPSAGRGSPPLGGGG